MLKAIPLLISEINGKSHMELVRGDLRIYLLELKLRGELELPDGITRIWIGAWQVELDSGRMTCGQAGGTPTTPGASRPQIPRATEICAAVTALVLLNACVGALGCRNS